MNETKDKIKTICSCCGNVSYENSSLKRFIVCSKCHRYIAVGSKYIEKRESKAKKVVKGGIKKMEKTKKLNVSAKVRELLAAGKSIEDIAKELNVPKKRVLDIRWQVSKKQTKEVK